MPWICDPPGQLPPVPSSGRAAEPAWSDCTEPRGCAGALAVTGVLVRPQWLCPE